MPTRAAAAPADRPNAAVSHLVLVAAMVVVALLSAMLEAPLLGQTESAQGTDVEGETVESGDVETGDAEGGVRTQVDRIVAVVDDDPILRSDMDRIIRLGLVVRERNETEEDFETRVLDEIIVYRLRSHEVDRFGSTELPLAQIEAQYKNIRSRYSSEEAFEEALGELGLDSDALRELLARQLMVVSYVEDRLGPRVFVTLEDIESYYDTVLTREMQRLGEPVPPLAEVREKIRAVLREKRLNEELDEWTEDLRLQADIVDYLGEEPRELPPIVQ